MSRGSNGKRDDYMQNFHPGSHLTGLARLSCNRKVDFVALNLGTRISAKQASPAH